MNDKIWFYHDWLQAYGPFTKQEILKLIQQRKVKKDFHLWHRGLEDWICVKDIDLNSYVCSEECYQEDMPKELPEFNPNIFGSKKTYNYDKGRACVKIAAILLMLVGALWILESLNEILFSGYYENSLSYLTLGWNMVVSVATIIIGLQVFKIKTWSYSWGTGIAFLNLIVDSIYIKDNGVNYKLFFIPIYLAIIILLFNNERIFKEQKKEEANN